jgi:hypothetical protein
MTEQLSLFPNSPLDTLNCLQDKKFADFEAALNPVDEVFTASTRLWNSRNFMELLNFIVRFPNYSAFNGLLLYIQKDTSYLIHLNKTHSLEEKYSSLAHELGHIFCGHLGIDRYAWWPERENLNISGEEIEAGCVAYLVCKRKGLRACSEKYLSNYIGANQEIPSFSLNAVLQAVNYVEEMGKHRWKEPRKRRRN